MGVERLADILSSRSPDDPEIASGAAFSRYGRLLALELEQMDRLIAPAYEARSNFRLFAAHSLLYFALVSFEEASQRLREIEAPWWRGFLGAGDPSRTALLDQAAQRIRSSLAAGKEGAAFEAWIRESIAPFDIAGLSDPGRNNLYPVDLELLVERAPRLGLSSDSIHAALPRLRGMEESA
jgi:FADH2 O2-dependent halogenase